MKSMNDHDARHLIDPRAGVLPPGVRPRAEKRLVLIPASVKAPKGYEGNIVAGDKP